MGWKGKQDTNLKVSNLRKDSEALIIWNENMCVYEVYYLISRFNIFCSLAPFLALADDFTAYFAEKIKALRGETGHPPPPPAPCYQHTRSVTCALPPLPLKLVRAPPLSDVSLHWPPACPFVATLSLHTIKFSSYWNIPIITQTKTIIKIVDHKPTYTTFYTKTP